MDVMSTSTRSRRGAELVTVAIRRIHLDNPSGKTMIDYIDRTRYQIVPNTAGCTTAKDAVLTAHLARKALGTDLIKLEVIGDLETLYPTRPRQSPLHANSCVKGLPYFPT